MQQLLATLVLLAGLYPLTDLNPAIKERFKSDSSGEKKRLQD